MRVISGIARGSKLIAPTGLTTRPTSDFNKESLFNILGNTVRDCNFLDIFAGTGAIGIEALSRYANFACFIDNDIESIKCINQNLAHTKLFDKAKVIKGDVLTSLSTISNNFQFDIIFMDPPYANNIKSEILHKIISENMLCDNAVIIIEQSSDNEIIEIPGLSVYKTKKYKTTTFIFYEKSSFIVI